MLVLGFADYEQQAARLAHCLGVECREVVVHRFPDGESKIVVPTALPAHIVLCRSFDKPNDKLIELLLTVQVARQQGAQRITLVAPYLCYMRQDIAFQPGEAVSQRIIGQFLARLVDDLITVDPHLHRIDRLEQAVPIAHAVTLSAATALADFLPTRWSNPLLLGPDSESEQWVQAIALRHGWQYGVASKQRLGDREVRIIVPDLDYRGRDIVLIDDMASTGHTLSAAARQVAMLNPYSLNALITHALFDEHAMALLRTSGIGFVGSSDSVSHASNVVQLAPWLAEAVRRIG